MFEGFAGTHDHPIDPAIEKIIQDASKRIKELEKENEKLKKMNIASQQVIDYANKQLKKMRALIGSSNLDQNKVKEYLLRD